VYYGGLWQKRLCKWDFTRVFMCFKPLLHVYARVNVKTHVFTPELWQFACLIFCRVGIFPRTKNSRLLNFIYKCSGLNDLMASIDSRRPFATIYRCKRCRLIIGTSSNVLHHKPSQKLDWVKMMEEKVSQKNKAD